MTLSLTETQALSELGEHLYQYLPGSSAWRGTYTFAHAAADAGVESFWQGGSKLPAIASLLELTLERRRDAFCSLVETVVRRGMQYRARKKNPLTRQDVERLNALVARMGFKIPALWDPKFLRSLPDAPGPAQGDTDGPSESISQVDEASLRRRRVLDELRARFLALQAQADRQEAGHALEALLNELFSVFGLQPGEPFRVVGEQIDGSFLLDSEVYLLEAKWTQGPTPEAELLAFRGKIEGKSRFTRGLFLSVNGFSAQAVSAITKGKQPTFVMMDGADLYRVLDRHIDLQSLLRQKIRRLAERGEPYVPVSELWLRPDNARTTEA